MARPAPGWLLWLAPLAASAATAADASRPWSASAASTSTSSLDGPGSFQQGQHRKPPLSQDGPGAAAGYRRRSTRSSVDEKKDEDELLSDEKEIRRSVSVQEIEDGPFSDRSSVDEKRSIDGSRHGGRGFSSCHR